MPYPEHFSKNDVVAIVNLLKGIHFPQKDLLLPPKKLAPKYNLPKSERCEYQYDATNSLLHKIGCPLMPEGIDRLGFSSLVVPVKREYKPCDCVKDELRIAKRQKVIDEINKTPYIFMYTENGSIFHRRDCGLLHNAKRILGTVRYDTVIKKGLRPCKICNPSRSDAKRPKPKRIILPNKPIKLKNSKPRKPSLPRPEMNAMIRLEQSQKERLSKSLLTEMTAQEKNDLITLTQPGLAFFASKGCKTFHVRICNRIQGKSDICGFDTFAHALRAGYKPCKYCKPTKKQDIVVSIPIDNKIREDESIGDLEALCNKYGYSYINNSEKFELETPVGKWIIHIAKMPIIVEHINLVKEPRCKKYHKQHRVFLSMLDALQYIRKHDLNLMKSSTANAANNDN